MKPHVSTQDILTAETPVALFALKGPGVGVYQS